jgi:hypothetical protein
MESRAQASPSAPGRSRFPRRTGSIALVTVSRRIPTQRFLLLSPTSGSCRLARLAGFPFDSHLLPVISYRRLPFPRERGIKLL